MPAITAMRVMPSRLSWPLLSTSAPTLLMRSAKSPMPPPTSGRPPTMESASPVCRTAAPTLMTLVLRLGLGVDVVPDDDAQHQPHHDPDDDADVQDAHAARAQEACPVAHLPSSPTALLYAICSAPKEPSSRSYQQVL